jgi:uncharacterized protein YfeS
MVEIDNDCFYLCKNNDESPFCIDGDLDDFIFFDEPVKLKSER